MVRFRQFGFCLLLAIALSANAANTNTLVWHVATDRVSADIRGEKLWPLLENIAHQTGWHIFVEPDAEHDASVKFQNLQSSDALKMLLGDLNFALVSPTNAPAQLYVFKTSRQNATRPVVVRARHVPNELILRVKPGTDMDALAKLLGAKIIGRLDGLGLYRLQFADAAATDAALAQLQNDSDVLAASYNNYLDAPPPVQSVSAAGAPLPPINLQLKPPSDSGKIIVGLVDTAVQPLDGSLNNFLLKQVSVADGTQADSPDLTHGTAMAETILRAVGITEQGNSSVQILPVDVYGSAQSATTWNVASGIVSAVNGGANIINLSLGGPSEDAILAGVIQSVENDGIPIFAAAGNQPTASPTYPAAYSGIYAVTALEQGKIAPYANYGSFISFAAPDGTIAYLGNQAWFTAGTSVSTANMTGIAAGYADATHQSWPQITAKLYQSFSVPRN